MEKDNVVTQSMYLNTLPNKNKKFGFIRSTLDVSDIQGARSGYLEHPKPERYTNLNSSDIEKCHPKQLIPK